MRILLIEDQKDIARFIVNGLRAERFAVDWADVAEKAIAWAKFNTYDLGIFDVKLSGMSGLDVCRVLRGNGMVFPIIMLSVMNDAITKVAALNYGADDYLQKPFFMAELTARARALLRREKRMIEPLLKIGDIVMDMVSHTVIRGTSNIRLNRKEFGLLEYFMRNPGITLTRAMILEHVWDADVDPFTNTVDVHVRFLRQKIDDGFEKKFIKTVHGYGYRFDA